MFSCIITSNDFKKFILAFYFEVFQTYLNISGYSMISTHIFSKQMKWLLSFNYIGSFSTPRHTLILTLFSP